MLGGVFSTGPFVTFESVAAAAELEINGLKEALRLLSTPALLGSFCYCLCMYVFAHVCVRFTWRGSAAIGDWDTGSDWAPVTRRTCRSRQSQSSRSERPWLSIAY